MERHPVGRTPDLSWTSSQFKEGYDFGVCPRCRTSPGAGQNRPVMAARLSGSFH